MASVPLRMIPPNTEDLVALKIWEGASALGPFAVIEEVLEIGSYPDYIDHYTTVEANSATNWFAISWVDSKDAESDLSEAVQGGTSTIVSEVVERVILRDATLNRNVVFQEAEAIVEIVFGNSPPDLGSVTSRQLRGLTYLTMARAYYGTIVDVSASSGWVAGLVSEKSGLDTKSREAAIRRLLQLANDDLGLASSVIFQMEDVCIGPYSLPNTNVLTQGIVIS